MVVNHQPPTINHQPSTINHQLTKVNKYKRVVLKLSGEILQGEESFGIDDSELTRIAQELVEIHNDGIEVGIVIGGGNFFRGASSIAKQMKRTAADDIGMLATLQNSIALYEKFKELNVQAEIFSARRVGNLGTLFDVEKAKVALSTEKITIFGGGTGNPFFTTDTAAILRALEIEAEIVIKGTKVDGIFDKDPQKSNNPNFFKTISFEEYIRRDLKVMDLTAISLAKEYHLPIKVFNIKKIGNIKRAIYEDDFGSIIL